MHKIQLDVLLGVNLGIRMMGDVPCGTLRKSVCSEKLTMQGI